LLPGFIATLPSLHIGQFSGAYISKEKSSSAKRGTSEGKLHSGFTLLFPPTRLQKPLLASDAKATTSAPKASIACAAS